MSTSQTSEKLLPVELGYLEESIAWRLESHFFPSKVGGRPAWLSFKPVPTPEMLRCGVCAEPCVFLLQVYAPLETVPSAFHRSLYVFVCRNPECCVANTAENFVVLRCQLPRVNEFFASEPLNLDEIEAAATEKGESPSSYLASSVKRQDDYNNNKLCAVCACAADKQCGQCKDVYYCCKSHQEAHWKLGGHKESCRKAANSKTPVSEGRNPLAFPEYELVTEAEYYVEQKTKERSEAERLRSYEEYMQQQRSHDGGGVNGMNEESVQHLEAVAKTADKDFKLFRRRLEQNPEQVLRYQRSGTPLWANTIHTPKEADIPTCSLCGAPRIFEFQIMPHLLSYLDVDSVGTSLDWATVVVYTCKNSCDVPEYGYTREWIWKQDYVE